MTGNQEEEREGREEKKVNLGGMVPLSTVDWVGVAAIVVFLRGCPLRCPHCHNWHLQKGESFEDFSTVKSEIKKAALFVSALVLSGGEPLMQPKAARSLALFAHGLGLKVGVESCGYYPARLTDLAESGLVDKVFLDVKAPLKDPDYARATGREGVAPRTRKCLDFCIQSGVPFEARTTVFPGMSHDDIRMIADDLIKIGIDSLTLQQGLPREGEKSFEPVSAGDLKEMAEICEVQGVAVKVRARGEED